jgi:hypothetical protein
MEDIIAETHYGKNSSKLSMFGLGALGGLIPVPLNFLESMQSRGVL